MKKLAKISRIKKRRAPGIKIDIGIFIKLIMKISDYFRKWEDLKKSLFISSCYFYQLLIRSESTLS